MSRYEARQDRHGTWSVDKEGEHGYLGVLPEAEARIIAWALNAVAEGHGLIEVVGGHIRDWRGYDGPTDGVAP